MKSNVADTSHAGIMQIISPVSAGSKNYRYIIDTLHTLDVNTIIKTCRYSLSYPNVNIWRYYNHLSDDFVVGKLRDHFVFCRSYYISINKSCSFLAVHPLIPKEKKYSFVYLSEGFYMK